MLVMKMPVPSNLHSRQRDADPVSHSRAADRELVRRLLEGDEAAFDEFASMHLEALYRFAGRRLEGDRELTREIVQRTLCKVFGKLSTYRGEGPFLGWLCACCRNEILMHFRAEGSRPDRLALETGVVPPGALAAPARGHPDRELLRSELGEQVHLALDLLPVHYAQALEWKYVEGLPVREIARRLELSEKAAESTLSRARVAFRKRYRELRRTGSPETRSEG